MPDSFVDSNITIFCNAKMYGLNLPLHKESIWWITTNWSKFVKSLPDVKFNPYCKACFMFIGFMSYVSLLCNLGTLNQRIFLIGQWKSVGKTKIQIELACKFSEGDFLLIQKSSSPIDFICVYLDWKVKSNTRNYLTHINQFYNALK